MRIADNVSAIKRALDKITGAARSGTRFSALEPGEHPKELSHDVIMECMLLAAVTVSIKQAVDIAAECLMTKDNVTPDADGLFSISADLYAHKQHYLDPTTGICLECGATLEMIDGGLAPTCNPDDGPQPFVDHFVNPETGDVFIQYGDGLVKVSDDDSTGYVIESDGSVTTISVLPREELSPPRFLSLAAKRMGR